MYENPVKLLQFITNYVTVSKAFFLNDDRMSLLHRKSQGRHPCIPA